jgi:hypothetical protein
MLQAWKLRFILNAQISSSFIFVCNNGTCAGHTVCVEESRFIPDTERPCWCLITMHVYSNLQSHPASYIAYVNLTANFGHHQST